MTTRPRIAVVGSYGVGWTFAAPTIPAPGETVTSRGLQREHGGKGSNQAVAAARFGADVHLLTAVGRDDAGDGAIALWETEGITATARQCDSPTMVGMIVVAPSGENAIVIEPGALSELTSADVDAWQETLRTCDLCVVQLEIPVDVAAHALRVASAAGVPTLCNPAPWSPLPADLHRHIDYLVPNETEVAAMLGRPYHDHPDPGAALGDAARIATIVTEGARGASIHQPDGRYRFVEATPVDAVDTTGAGDSFVGALAVGIASGMGLLDAVTLGCRAAARSVTGHGVIPALPYRDQIQEPAQPTTEGRE